MPSCGAVAPKPGEVVSVPDGWPTPTCSSPLAAPVLDGARSCHRGRRRASPPLERARRSSPPAPTAPKSSSGSPPDILARVTQTFDEFADLVRSRRTHLLVDRDRDVAPELVGELCELATWAPNHKRTWPWRFALVHGRGSRSSGLGVRRRHDRSRLRRRGQAHQDADEVLPHSRRSLVVGCAAHEKDTFHGENRDAVAAGIQNLLLGATAAGPGVVLELAAADGLGAHARAVRLRRRRPVDRRGVSRLAGRISRAAATPAGRAPPRVELNPGASLGGGSMTLCKAGAMPGIEEAERALELADEASTRIDVEAVVAHLSAAIRGFTAADDNRRPRWRVSASATCSPTRWATSPPAEPGSAAPVGWSPTSHRAWSRDGSPSRRWAATSTIRPRCWPTPSSPSIAHVGSVTSTSRRRRWPTAGWPTCRPDASPRAWRCSTRRWRWRAGRPTTPRQRPSRCARSSPRATTPATSGGPSRGPTCCASTG